MLKNLQLKFFNAALSAAVSFPQASGSGYGAAVAIAVAVFQTVTQIIARRFAPVIIRRTAARARFDACSETASTLQEPRYSAR